MADRQDSVARASEAAVALRRELHRHPELSWREVETTKKIAARMAELGVSVVKKGFKGTQCGLVAEIKGAKPGPTLMIRADIDALPVAEDPSHDVASECAGVMHACGHDAHAASLIGAAKIFKALERDLPGRVRLMFQPSEEQATAPGAKALIEEGMLDGVDAVIGYHVRAGAPEGEIQFTPGPATTSGDIWELDVVGKGGHGSRPQDAVDPTVAAAQIICALQTVVSREIPPGERVVVSIGTLKSGSAVNVIPEKCEITGNIRTTNPAVRATLPERIERIAQGVGLAMRCRTDFRFIPVYPSVVNDEAMCQLLEQAAGELFGPEKVKRVPISSGSDDFNFYSAERPSIYFNVGMGGPGTPYAAAHHSPQFRTNDAILKTCAAAVVATACKFLEAKAK